MRKKYFLQKRYKTWYVRCTINGKSYEKTTGERNERKAWEKAKVIFQEWEIENEENGMIENDNTFCLREDTISTILQKNVYISEFLSFIQRQKNRNGGYVSREELFIQFLPEFTILMSKRLLERYWRKDSFQNTCPEIVKWVNKHLQKKS